MREASAIIDERFGDFTIPVVHGGIMATLTHDRDLVRPLAERYAELSGLEVQRERIERYFKTIRLEEVRPIVLIDEVPWGEIEDDDLVLRSEDDQYRALEERLRRALYQWEHFQGDFVIPNEFAVSKEISTTGIGIEVNETVIESDTGSYAAAHQYQDQIKNDEDLEKIRLPKITYEKQKTERSAEVAESVFAGLLPVKIKGGTLTHSIWDEIAKYRGVDNLLIDLAMRPDFMHSVARKFMEIGAARFDQLLAMDLLDPNPMLVHCTIACAEELPAEDFSGDIRQRDVWGRCAAQIFSAVSPEMHDEFDLTYNQELFGDCGLLYYGCCEPLDNKIDLLRNRFANLRKVSITPWADPVVAADQIGSDFVLAGKPNPAFVNSRSFNPAPVREEMNRFMEACKRNGTTCEFVLKDISTIANRTENLTRWIETVEEVVDNYY